MMATLFLRQFRLAERSALFAALCTLFTFLSPSGALAQSSVRYGAYNLFPQGSSRAMGMGGAYTALSDDITGILYNPAGLAFDESRADLGGTLNRLNNREASNDSLGDLSNATDFIFAGAAFRMGRWAIAAGYSSPYQLDLENFNKARIDVTSANLTVARQFNKKFSVGIGGHAEQTKIKYEDDSNAVNIEESQMAYYPSFGLSFRGNKGGMGLSYTPTREFDIDTTKNSQTANVDILKDVVIPGKLSFGVYVQLGRDAILNLDIDKFEAVSNAVYFASGTLTTQDFNSPLPIVEKEQTVMHGGIEWAVIRSKSTELILRGGAYTEPARLEGAPARSHMTYGVEARFGPAVLSVSFDQAKQFNNTAQGFSIAIGSI